ncbi:MAG TPA: tetratricopeptide repeat protein [Kofleriaceae bacterium]
MGDLLTFAPGQVRTLGPRPGSRCGLRRGTSATRWYELGCRLEASEPARAIAAYERAVAGCPGFADAHNNLGRLLHDAGSLGAAESSYRLAICADPGIALYWFNLGVAVEDQGRRAEAIAAYERAIEISERSEAAGGGDPAGVADAHYNLARLLELTGRRTGDELMLRRAVRHLLRYRELTRRNARAH